MTHDDALVALTIVAFFILWFNGMAHAIHGYKTWNKVMYAVVIILLSPPLFYVYNLALLG